jgi:methyl-accepting chemotaxis protein
MNIKNSVIVAVITFFVISCVNVFIGLNISNKMGSMLEYISGPAWNAADGAMEGQIGLEAQVILIQRIYHNEISIEQGRKKLDEAIKFLKFNESKFHC